ncbi:hypothetical protein E3N88_22966 [Mikania micrantha]|uniref:Leucine-rich repeat-containing N-terminal plant-type domain-containing protein n=1 Tax=Mikania micrantha TaxID=192012 RepID=A0A5N6NEL7_9ASTR|nr:hypothetical protein E3N88_22966 [Mikania micrantha]
MVGWAHQGITIEEEEEERKALLEIKASLLEFSKSYDNLLSSWVVDDGSSYCDWEMINCNSTSSSSSGNSYKYVKDLSLGNIFSIEDDFIIISYSGKHGGIGSHWLCHLWHLTSPRPKSYVNYEEANLGG